MKILDVIHQLAQKKGLDFILIGGHAINVIGDRRQTRDVDLLVCETDKVLWKEILSGLDYELFNESDAFMQFNPEEIEQWPLDILLVNEQTFEELMAEASSINLGGQENILIPSVKHLISMKLHTLKQGNQVRRLKDLLDIMTLVRYGKIDIYNDEFKQMCTKYASGEDYDEIIKLYKS